MRKFTLSALSCLLMGVFAAQAQFMESFDVAETPDGWTVINLAGPEAWQFGPVEGEYPPYSGDGVAFINWSQGHDDYLITPQFTVTTGVSDQLRFYSRNWGTPNGFNNQDMFNVELSTTGNAAEDFTVVLESNIIPPTEWTEYIYNLSEYAGQEIYIALRAITDGSQMRLYMDDVHIEAIPSCPKPSHMAASMINETEALITWTENGNAAQWEVVYGEQGFDPATAGTTVSATGTPEVSITGLTPDTHYDYYVKAICSSNDESIFSVKASFFSGYCPFVSTSIDRFIKSFSTSNGTENISNLNSGQSPDGYGNFTDMVVSTYGGGSFDVSVIPNVPEEWMTYTIGIWIDFNNNMVFDESEKVLLENYVPSASGTVTVPLGTPNGDYRMRVVADGIEYFLTPCAGGEYSEAEDYTVSVIDPPSCLPVSGISVVNVYAESVDLAWTAHNNETNWEVVYGEAGFNPATEGVTIEVSGSSNVTLTELTDNTQYEFYITAICSENETSSMTGPVGFRTLCLSTGVPYIMNFDDAIIPFIPLCTFEENTGSGNDWETFEHFGNGFSGTVLRYNYNSQFPASAWFYTQGIALESGTNYMISYKYGNNNGSYQESLKIDFGTSPQQSAMVNILANHPEINSAQAQTNVVNFTVPSTGVYYFGFKAYSVPNQFALYLDDIEITEGSICDEPEDISVSNIEAYTATVSWTTASTAAQGNEVSVFLGGDDPATDAPMFTQTYTPLVGEAEITGLAPSTTYDVYVTSMCGGLATSTSSAVSFTTDTNVGVNNYDVTQIDFFPNPVKDQLTVTAPSAIASITVYNLLGATVMQIDAKATDVVVDMSVLPAGAYILKARVAEGVSTFKVIKE